MSKRIKSNKNKQNEASSSSSASSSSCTVGDIQQIFDEHCSCYGTTYHPVNFPPVPKIVSFGDIHGDYALAIEMFESANLIDDDYNWIGEDTYVVQVGDQVDRCRPIPGGPVCKEPEATKNGEDSDVRIMKLFNKLDRQAQEVGGRVISLFGNHELMNSMGQLQYVSYAGLKGFENYEDPQTNEIIADGMEARAHAFAPGNEYGKMLGCTRYPAVIIGANIFVHAGIVDSLIDNVDDLNNIEDLEKINIKMRMWLLNLMDQACIDHIAPKNPDLNPDSMFWTRALGKIKPGVPLDSPECMDNLSKALKIFHVMGKGKKVRMIIGHTPQSFMYSDDINSTCSNRIWRVDNGSSKAFDSFDPKMLESSERADSRRPQYLLILNDSEYYVCDEDGCKRESELQP